MKFSEFHPLSDPNEPYYSKLFRLDALQDAGLSYSEFQHMLFKCLDCESLITRICIASHTCYNEQMMVTIHDPMDALDHLDSPSGLSAEVFRTFFEQCAICSAIMSKRVAHFHRC